MFESINFMLKLEIQNQLILKNHESDTDTIDRRYK